MNRLDRTFGLSMRLEIWRDGAFFCEAPAEQISLRMEESADIRVAMQARMRPVDGADLFYDRLRPVQTVDGVDYPLGEFLAATVSETDGPEGVWWEVEAYDQTLLLRQERTGDTLFFTPGTPYLDAIGSLLADCGITRVIAEPTGRLIPLALGDWEIGTELLTVVNDLLDAIGYDRIWFDRNGAARLAPAQGTGGGQFTVDDTGLLIGGTTRETDLYSACNVFTAVCAPPSGEGAPMVATAVNDSPFSPLSTVRRGRRICAPVVFLDGIADQEALEARARQLLSHSLYMTETVFYETAPVPTHWIGELAAVGSEILRETGWELTLGPGGSYRHTARKVVAV